MTAMPAWTTDENTRLIHFTTLIACSCSVICAGRAGLSNCLFWFYVSRESAICLFWQCE